MNENDVIKNIESELLTLKQQVLALAGIVESVFAESVIALVDSDMDAAHEAQLDDYKAHQVWLKADSLAVDILATGKLSLDDVHLVYTMSHMSLNLKRMADKGMHIANLINECPLDSLPNSLCNTSLSKMTELAQTMFSNSIEAFINHDPSEANGLHPLYNEVKNLNKELLRGINEALRDNSQSILPESVTALVVIGGCMENIAELALDTGNCIAKLYKHNNNHNSADLDGIRE